MCPNIDKFLNIQMLFAADEGILYVPDNDEATTRMIKAK
jgi:hypothetical protein